MFKIDLNSADFPPRFRDTLIVQEVGKDIDYDFTITDPQGDSVYAYATGAVFSSKYVSPPATFKADSGLGKITAHFPRIEPDLYMQRAAWQVHVVNVG